MKKLLPKDRVDGLQIEIPGAGVAVYRVVDRRACLRLTECQRAVLRRAIAAHSKAAARAKAAGIDAEDGSGWLDGFEPEPVVPNGVVWSRDYTRPDGSVSSTGETRLPCDSPKYYAAYRAEYTAAIASDADGGLAKWITTSGVFDLLDDLAYCGHDLGIGMRVNERDRASR